MPHFRAFFFVYFRELAGTRLSLQSQGASTVSLPELGPRLQSPLVHLYSLRWPEVLEACLAAVLSTSSSHILSMKKERGPQSLTGWGSLLAWAWTAWRSCLASLVSPWFSSVQFSSSVMSDSLRRHGLQHARLPCPSPTPRACSNSYPLSW